MREEDFGSLINYRLEQAKEALRDAELLLDEATGKINQEQRQCLNDILNNAQRLLELINHLSSQRGSEPAKEG